MWDMGLIWVKKMLYFLPFQFAIFIKIFFIMRQKDSFLVLKNCINLHQFSKMDWVEIFRIYSLSSPFVLAFSVCLFLIYVSLCQCLSSCVYMCFYEPFFIYLCLTLYLFLYVWLYLSIFLFLSLSLSGSALSKKLNYQIMYRYIHHPPPHKWNIPVYHTLSRLYCMVFVITI